MKRTSSEPEVGDIIEWKEPIWAPPHQKRGKPNKIGEQKVTAELIATGESFELDVKAVEIISLKHGVSPAVVKVKAGDRIRRKKSTIEMGT